MTNARTIPTDVQAELEALRRRLAELEQAEAALRQTEAALRRTESFLASIIEHSPHAMWISDEKGTLIKLNQACRDLLSITDDEVVGKYNILEDSIVEAQGYLALVRSVFEEGKRVRFVIEYDSSRLKAIALRRAVSVVLDVTISPVRDASGRVCNAIIQHIDITERRRAEQALEQSKEAEHRFAQRLTALHEVNNLLTRAGSVDDLCRQAVGLGRERLGFDRLGIWFLGEDQRHIRGSFGTDEHGQIRDERGRTVPLGPLVKDALASRQRAEVIKQDRAELHDATGRAVGQGPLAWTPIWDGQKTIGFLYADGLLQGKPITDRDCEVLALYGSALGHLCIRQWAEEALRGKEEELRAILESTADGILAVNEHGQVIHANQRFARLWRISEGLLQTRDDNRLLAYVLEQLIEPAAFLSKVRQLYVSSEVDFDTLLFKDRRVFERFSCPLIRNGALAGRVWSFRDVTERRQTEEARRESEQRLRQVVESLPIILYSVEGGTNRFLLVMGAVQEMIGYEPEFLMNAGDVSGRFVHPEDQPYVYATFKRGLESRKPFEVEYRVVHGQDGRSVWVREYVVPLVGADGTVIRQDGVVLDVTDQKTAEAEHDRVRAELLQAQKLQSIGVLAGGIAHDFNNLLTVISGNAQVLARRLSHDPACVDILKDIETAATHATEMTQSLQAFSRPTKPRIRHSDANTLVNEAYRLLRRVIPATIDFQLDLEPSPCTIAADPGQMQQVLVNLCVNARDAMPSGGRLTIQTRPVGRDALPASAQLEAEHDHYIRLRVTDTGCGMDAEILARVFDPFFTTKPLDRGTGLGLAIVYRIVQTHGGAIQVASQPGAGTSFDLFFPASEAAPEPPSECEAPTARGEEHILVVEGEEMVGTLLRTVLEGRGYTVRLASRPEEALNLARTSPRPFDLAIIDYALPHMTGDRVLAELRQTHPALKAVLVTGYDIDEASLAVSHCRLLRKPFAVTTIAQTVRDALDNP